MPGNQVIGKDVVLIGQEVVAAELHVTSQAISNWYKREALATAADGPGWGMPAPVLIQFTPGKKPQKVWKKAQLPAWVKWHAAHLAEHGQHIPARNKARAEVPADGSEGGTRRAPARPRQGKAA